MFLDFNVFHLGVNNLAGVAGPTGVSGCNLDLSKYIAYFVVTCLFFICVFTPQDFIIFCFKMQYH